MGWGWGGEGGGISLSSNGKIDMNACKIYIVPLNVATEFESLEPNFSFAVSMKYETKLINNLTRLLLC